MAGTDTREESVSLGTLARVQAAIRENADELSRLDAATGDGDHGHNLARAFHEAMLAVERQADQSPAAVLHATCEALGAVDCASARLYAAACRAAGEALAARPRPDPRDLAATFEAGVAAIETRGGVTVGDKTMVDALRPASDALRAAVEGGANLTTALERARAAAHAGMEASAALPGSTGQAAALGERAIGHRDPGATSAYLIVQAMALAARGYAGAAGAAASS